jgi:cytosine/adenosine deaminase-related metal-dependent hydrolase
VDYIAKFGLLSPALTIGHGVWMSDSDIDVCAAAGVRVCHNCSSNFRLASGRAPITKGTPRY